MEGSHTNLVKPAPASNLERLFLRDATLGDLFAFRQLDCLVALRQPKGILKKQVHEVAWRRAGRYCEC